MNQNAKHYWRQQVRRIRLLTEELQQSIDEVERQRCFDIMQNIQDTLYHFRSSIRENMGGGDTTK